MKKSITYQDKSPQRLDKFIHSLNSDVSRRFFQNAIKNKKVLVNGKSVSPSYKLKENDEIKINIKKESQVDFEIRLEKNIPFEVIFEHQDFLIVNKPAGISVHPCENERFGTLVNGLIKRFPEIKNVGENKWRPGIVHRLDKETSGVLIVAKNQKSFKYFKKLFQERNIQKTYLAWAWGSIKEKKGEINAYIGKSNQNPTKQAVSHNPEKLINPKEAVTYYKVIKELADKSLLELKPKTGRKHQIRLHLHSIGHPILGDKKYANKKISKWNTGFNRHLLHAKSIQFNYIDGSSHRFKSASPEDMNLNS